MYCSLVKNFEKNFDYWMTKILPQIFFLFYLNLLELLIFGLDKNTKYMILIFYFKLLLPTRSKFKLELLWEQVQIYFPFLLNNLTNIFAYFFYLKPTTAKLLSSDCFNSRSLFTVYFVWDGLRIYFFYLFIQIIRKRLLT